MAIICRLAARSASWTLQQLQKKFLQQSDLELQEVRLSRDRRGETHRGAPPGTMRL